jgi:hypothetical protein
MHLFVFSSTGYGSCVYAARYFLHDSHAINVAFQSICLHFNPKPFSIEHLVIVEKTPSILCSDCVDVAVSGGVKAMFVEQLIRSISHFLRHHLCILSLLRSML